MRKHHPTRALHGDHDGHASDHRGRGHMTHEGGRRTHEHGHHSGGHDAHIRHSHDHKNKTHMHNAVRHLAQQHGAGGMLGGSLDLNAHYSHAQEPHPHAKKDTPGV